MRHDSGESRCPLSTGIATWYYWHRHEGVGPLRPLFGSRTFVVYFVPAKLISDVFSPNGMLA
jgi:hypothetical protein